MSASWEWCVWVGIQEERTPSVRVLLDTPVVDVLLVGPIFRISLAIHYCIVGHVWRKTTWLPLTLLRVWGLRTKTKKLAHLKELLEFWVKIVSKISGLNRIKNGRVMPIQSWGKSGVLAYLGPKLAIF